RPEQRPEAGPAPHPQSGQCPTRALVEATQHHRRRLPPRRAQRRDAKAEPPRPASPRCQHPYLGGSFTLPVALTCIAIEPEKTPDGTTSAYLWKTCRQRSLRHRQEAGGRTSERTDPKSVV